MSNTTFNFISKEIAIYAGIPIFVFGVIGGVFNIIVFLSFETFRKSSCAIFLTTMAFVNIGQLLKSLLTRIMITGFELDWTETSVFYCKFRNYCLQVCALCHYLFNKKEMTNKRYRRNRDVSVGDDTFRR